MKIVSSKMAFLIVKERNRQISAEGSADFFAPLLSPDRVVYWQQERNKSGVVGAVMDYKIRRISEEEYSLLEHFLYEAIFVPEGVPAPPKSIINQPELQLYIADFGKKEDDIGLVAEVDNKIVGAVWARIINDYGHIDNDTPSFAISLYKDYRGLGIGTALMQEMLRTLKSKGYKQASLAVQKLNYAVEMYKKVGFEIVNENEEEYIMLCRLG